MAKKDESGTEVNEEVKILKFDQNPMLRVSVRTSKKGRRYSQISKRNNDGWANIGLFTRDEVSFIGKAMTEIWEDLPEK